MNGAAEATKQYLEDALGIEAKVCAWDRFSQVPYFLQNAYDLRKSDLLGHPVMLAIERREQKPNGRDLRVQLNRISEIAELPVIYVVNSLASYERRRLVEQKIQFIVPGNQLYLPALGIDFREHFRRARKPEGKPLSPATQAILISALMRKLWSADWAPDAIARELGYGPMTSSRAVKELTESQIAGLVARGRNRLLRFERSAAEVWNQAKPILRNPVKQSIWTKFRGAPPEELEALRAGQTALAMYSMIGDPQWPTYAVSASLLRKARSKFEVFAEPDDGAIELQIWSYGPKLLQEPKTVDPLSLTLSLQDSKDERIGIALDELKEEFPWSKA